MAHVREVAGKGGIAYEARWKVNGKFKQRTFTVKREAERFALKVENEIADGQSTDALVKNAKRFRDVAQASMDAATRLKPKTRRGYEDAYKLHIYPTFGDRRINSITSLEVEAWLAELETKPKRKPKDAPDDAPDVPLSASTRRGIVIALSKMFRYALKHRLITTNPCAVIEKPQIVREEPVFLSPGQAASIAAHLDEREPVYGLVVLVAANTGLRPGELEALRIRDINFLRRHVEIRRQAQYIAGEGWHYQTPKSAKSVRDVPLSPSLLAALRDRIATHPYRADPDALLWPGRRKGGPADKRATQLRRALPARERAQELRSPRDGGCGHRSCGLVQHPALLRLGLRRSRVQHPRRGEVDGPREHQHHVLDIHAPVHRPPRHGRS